MAQSVPDIAFPFFIAIIGIFAIVGFVVWIWALVDAIRVPDDSLYESGTKLIWILVIVLTGWIGAIIYIVVGRPRGGAAAAIGHWGTRQTPSPPGGVALPPPP